MQVMRNSIETGKGPSERFTGAVYSDPIAVASEASRLMASSVHFTPGARTAWHTHPHGQTLYVTEGVGLVQRRGGPIEVIRPGDRVFFEPGEDHWHGAAPNRFMTHLAMVQVDDQGNSRLGALTSPTRGTPRRRPSDDWPSEGGGSLRAPSPDYVSRRVRRTALYLGCVRQIASRGAIDLCDQESTWRISRRASSSIRGSRSCVGPTSVTDATA